MEVDHHKGLHPPCLHVEESVEEEEEEEVGLILLSKEWQRQKRWRRWKRMQEGQAHSVTFTEKIYV